MTRPSKKRHKDNLKSYLKWAGFEPKEWENAAADRLGCQAIIIRAAANFERDHSLAIAAAYVPQTLGF